MKDMLGQAFTVGDCVVWNKATPDKKGSLTIGKIKEISKNEILKVLIIKSANSYVKTDVVTSIRTNPSSIVVMKTNDLLK